MNPGDQFLRLGDMLVQRGFITDRKLQRGLHIAHETRRRIGDVLVELGYVSEEEVAHCLAEQYGFDYNDMTSVEPKANALDKLAAEFALKWYVLPVEDGLRFQCVIADPLNVELSDMISAIAHKPVAFSIAPKSVLIKAIRVAYGLPIPAAQPKGRRKKPPVPEAVMQRDRVMLLEAVFAELAVEQSMRRAS